MTAVHPDGTSQSTSGAADSLRQTSPFPSGPFDFSFGGYDTLFDIAAANTAATSTGYGAIMAERRDAQSSGVQYMHSADPSTMRSYPIHAPPHDTPHPAERLSTLVNPATLVDGGYHNVGVDNGNVNYQGILDYVYPSYQGAANITGSAGTFESQPYTHVDPTQLLNMEGDSQHVQNHSFHPSPSSDSWGAGNGFSSSTTASPEPYATSGGSTPPSGEASTNSTARRYGHAHRISGESGGRHAPLLPSGSQRKKGIGGPMTMNTGLRSSTSTPDLTSSADLDAAPGSGTGEEGESSVPTVCTNCRTTNTPLWRRDPEGQPLCK